MTPPGIGLDELAAQIGGELLASSRPLTPRVGGITHDSRLARPGMLFVCVPGERSDGHQHAPDAVALGAVALVVEQQLPVDVPQIRVADARRAMGPAAAAVYGHPDREITVIGVTGTNGKTTVTHMLASMLGFAGRSVEVLGTLSGSRTTPEATDLFAHLADLRDRSIRYLAMEVSSHALALHRVSGLLFDVAAFTNLSQDHLDFHSTMEDYFEAKARLFDPSVSRRAIVGVDDPAGRKLLERRPDAVPYGLADAESLRLDGPTSSFVWRGYPVTLQLAGEHNVQNALCAATVMAELGFSDDAVADALGAIDPVPGRMEWVGLGQPFRVVVDFAHTPESLRVALAACRNSAADQRKVLVVFGCGGDRDRAKRPSMGAVAAAGADTLIVTSDNPRSEDPQSIIDQILAGVPAGTNVFDEVDREKAIDWAVTAAEPGDVVLIAGKGHETTQIIGDRVVEFDDRVAAVVSLQRARW